MKLRIALLGLTVLVVLVGLAVEPHYSSLHARQPGPDAPEIGDPLPGLSDAQLRQFTVGKASFDRFMTDNNGIGPVFNGRSCSECHAGPVIGGGSAVLATRIGAIVNGQFDPLLRYGGPTLQVIGIAGLSGHIFAGEVVPPQATIVAHRRTTPLFGLGLVEAVPDQAFEMAAQQQALLTPATAGRSNSVLDLKTGAKVVGRFGWKAGRANLLDFSASASKDELGITMNGFLPDEDGRLLSEENPPQGNQALLVFNPVASPNQPKDRLAQEFASFQRFLAPPPRPRFTRTAARGESIFQEIGCADCHQPIMQTGPNVVAALHKVVFRPYSDFLLHDMGPLGDGIVQGHSTGREMRTAPLWGLRHQAVYLHDGRAGSVADAILAHDGQARPARDRFFSLRRFPSAQDDLLAFLNSL